MDNDSSTEWPGPPQQSQLVVYFQEYRELDLAALAKWVNSCDKEEGDTLQVQVESTSLGPSPGGMRVSTSAVSLGDFTIAIINHGAPEPSPSIIDDPRTPEKARGRLKDHRAFVLLTLLGGADYAPIERAIVLLKIGCALFEQGAIGLGLPAVGVALDREFLQSLLATVEKMADGGTFWSVMRNELEPMQLLQSTVMVDHAGTKWLVSRGGAMFGLHDFAWENPSPSQTEEILNLFCSGMCYLLTKGPVLAPGHTMGFDEDAAIRFFDGATEPTFPGDHFHHVLIMRREEGKAKKKGWLGKLLGG